jgi:hypothetical protein
MLTPPEEEVRSLDLSTPADVIIPGTTRGPLAVVCCPLPYLIFSGAALLMTATSSKSSSDCLVVQGVYLTTFPVSLPPDLKELANEIFLIILSYNVIFLYFNFA